MACKCNLASGQKHRCSSSIVPITSGLEKSPQNRIITPQVVELESVMRCWKSCLCLWWHIDQLYVLRRSWASQAEAARAHKTLLTKLQGKKSGWGKAPFRGKGRFWCAILCVWSTLCGCVTMCLSWRVVCHRTSGPFSETKSLKVGQPPAKCTTHTHTKTQFRAAQSQQKVACVTRWTTN